MHLHICFRVDGVVFIFLHTLKHHLETESKQFHTGSKLYSDLLSKKEKNRLIYTTSEYSFRCRCLKLNIFLVSQNIEGKPCPRTCKIVEKTHTNILPFLFGVDRQKRGLQLPSRS